LRRHFILNQSIQLPIVVRFGRVSISAELTAFYRGIQSGVLLDSGHFLCGYILVHNRASIPCSNVSLLLLFVAYIRLKEVH